MTSELVHYSYLLGHYYLLQYLTLTGIYLIKQNKLVWSLLESFCPLHFRIGNRSPTGFTFERRAWRRFRRKSCRAFQCPWPRRRWSTRSPEPHLPQLPPQDDTSAQCLRPHFWSGSKTVCVITMEAVKWDHVIFQSMWSNWQVKKNSSYVRSKVM